MKTIVISAVNLRKGGTLNILKNCLKYLSTISKDYRVVALVHKKELAEYPGIEYIEIPNALKSWTRRLWCEYVTMQKISKQLSPVHLWFSLHDTTPAVSAKKRAVYLQTSFPFFNWGIRDFHFDYKIPLFALLVKFAYRINIKKNDHLVVQQNWLKQGFSSMFNIEENKFIVAPPESKMNVLSNQSRINSCRHFLYVSTPDAHKNFELLCEAAEKLEKEIGAEKFKLTISINGSENKYARWIYEKWKQVTSINFAGFLDKKSLNEYYETADCLVFPSRIETWGLPISEFMIHNKPMLLANLPYAHETAAGSNQTAFFDVSSSDGLMKKMKNLVEGDFSILQNVSKINYEEPFAGSWKELFEILLKD